MASYVQRTTLVIACRACPTEWYGHDAAAEAWRHADTTGHPVTSYWQQSLEQVDG